MYVFLSVPSFFHMTPISSFVYIDGLVQDCSISIANALGILQFCTRPSRIYTGLWTPWNRQLGALADYLSISQDRAPPWTKYGIRCMWTHRDCMECDIMGDYRPLYEKYGLISTKRSQVWSTINSRASGTRSPELIQHGMQKGHQQDQAGVSDQWPR